MLTYNDRLKALRQTKIEHTLLKRKQNGYTDLDDFGTVPIIEGYSVTPWFNSTNGSFYGYDGMSENFCLVIDAHEPYVDPLEMLCGRWRDMLVNYRGDVHYAPDWLKKDEEYVKRMEGSSTMFSKRWDEQRFPYNHLKPLQTKYNIQTGIDGDAHLACDYSIGFELGFGGLLEKIRKFRDINVENKDFYDAEEKVLLAIIRFIDRHILKIEELIKTETREEIIASLNAMLASCKRIRLDPPKTFHDACQWTAFFNCASRIYTRDGAGFQLDGLLYKYYKNDKESGILDDETAKFLIANLLLIDPHYYQISGVDENDNDITNELSYIILDAADAINIACNLTVRVHENCDDKFFNKAVECLVKNKNGFPRFCNDKTLCEGYMRNGVDKKTARERIAVGCNWMCVPGKEFPMNDTVKINIAKVFMEAFNDMKNLENKSVELLYEIFEKHLKIAVDVTAQGVNLHIDNQWAVTPELVMNLLMKNTIEKGLDISKCAELYTVGVDGVGLAVVADSLAAIKQRVEIEKVISYEELYAQIESNFTNERIRLILNSTPKYCHGSTLADDYAVKLTNTWVNTVKNQSMPKGRTLIPGWFSWARTAEYGKTVCATPNGRRAGEPVSHGANPNPHFRIDGAVTAQSNGIASVQCGYGNPAPLQIEFDPGLTVENGVQIIGAFIKSHFDKGGTLININILDTEKLMKAHKDPELYPDLVVRVTGFTAYFASLSPQFRQLVIDRFISESKK